MFPKRARKESTGEFFPDIENRLQRRVEEKRNRREREKRDEEREKRRIQNAQTHLTDRARDISFLVAVDSSVWPLMDTGDYG